MKKRVLIIGGTSGYGFEITLHLLKKNFEVYIASRNNFKKDNFNKLKSITNSFKFFEIDISNEKMVREKINLILNDGKVDLIIVSSAISNAYKYRDFPLLKSNSEILKEFFEVNSLGALYTVKSLFPKITKLQRKVKIIFFTSKAGWSDLCHFGHYNLSKSLLHYLVLNLSSEIRECYKDFIFSSFILEPGEAQTRMNGGSTIHPKVIIPSINYIIEQQQQKHSIFLDRDLNLL